MRILMAATGWLLGGLTAARAANDGSWSYRHPRKKSEGRPDAGQADARSSRLNRDSRTRVQTCTQYSE